MYSIILYSDKYESEWDEFVMNAAVGGTFLHSRRFLNYHPKGRFKDASFLMKDEKGHLLAVCSACICEENGRNIFVSHKGSTFGGLLIHKKYYRTDIVLTLFEEMDVYLSSHYDGARLKLTLDLYSTDSQDLLKYCYQYFGFRCYRELNTYIDVKSLPNCVIDAFDRNKKRNIEKCELNNLTFRELSGRAEICRFHELLAINLSKYNLKPIHSPDELVEFNENRLRNETKFYGVFKGDVMMAAGMMFVFEQANVIHAQNLSADYTFTEYSPITYLYYKVIEQAKRDGFSMLTWGISTEDRGRVINTSLVRNKESYGSTYALNETFCKDYK